MITLVVFDQTSYFVIPPDELTVDLELMYSFESIEKAQEVADYLNSKI